ncbi:MAG: hypothetical protein WC750_04580 [Patescibacteria group bacterium]
MSQGIVRTGHEIVLVPSTPVDKNKKCFAFECPKYCCGRVVINSNGVMSELDACEDHGGEPPDAS